MLPRVPRLLARSQPRRTSEARGAVVRQETPEPSQGSGREFERKATSGDRHIVYTIHGINTYGQWQERLAKLVTRRSPHTEFVHYKYGVFPVPLMIFFPCRYFERKRFERHFKRLPHGSNIRLDVVAHSFGTHLV